jgi:Domain of unknown function (DUF4340)
MRKSRSTLLLLGIFIVLVVVAAAVNGTRQNNQNQVQLPITQTEIFPGVEPTQITRIALENHTTGHKVLMVKVPGGWQATDEKGQSVKIDPGQPPRMLQILSSLRYNRVMEGSDVKAFGLADGGIFSVSFDAGRSYTLLVGDVNSDSSFAFVQPGVGSAVLQVPAQVMASLLAPVSAGTISQ